MEEEEGRNGTELTPSFARPFLYCTVIYDAYLIE